jgi:hypothetical protein
MRHIGLVDTRPRIKAKKAMDHTRVHQALRGDCIMCYGCPYAGLGLHEAVAPCVTGCQGVCTVLKPLSVALLVICQACFVELHNPNADPATTYILNK